MSELAIIENKAFIGEEFLTWLLISSELRGGEFELEKHGRFSLVFDRKIVLASANEKVAWSGDITSIDQIRAAIQSGKKVQEAQFQISQGDRQWRFSIQSRLLQIRGLKTPKILAPDDMEFFFDKLDAIEEFIGYVDELYQTFIERRINEERWREELDQMRSWLTWS